MTDDQILKNILIKRIAEQGRMTFAAFMEACLYEPELGYYTSSGRKVGAEGDFYTSISVNAVFGRVIAREIAQMWRCMGKPGAFTVVECGAGNGRLACDIIDYLLAQEPEFYSAITLVLVEKEPSLKTAQIALLEKHADRLQWVAPEEFASGSFKFSGCLYSNELIDAMPVHRVLMGAEHLQEIYVSVKDGEFSEELGELSNPDILAYFEQLGVKLHSGQQAEVNLAAIKWISTVSKALENGFVMTIDYGYPALELYSPHRKLGSLLCYYHHQVEDNPYIRLGKQDITAHVDFSSLEQRGAEMGLEKVWFGEQYLFLMSAGIIKEIEESERSAVSEEEKLKLRLALKKLIMPNGGMGDTFRILIQSKAVQNQDLLCKRKIGF